MCGIAGIARHAGCEPQDRVHASRLQQLLALRGPDGAGTYFDERCVLVQTRLALVGPEYPLPLTSADARYAIAYNGEIYNFLELQSELGIAAPSDTHVVLTAWLRWGAAALRRLNGMFAFFIWDAVERRGFGACDPLGIKPFIYHSNAERFAFASEAGALIESGAVAFSPEPEALAESLVAPYFSSATILPIAGVKRLPPGHYLEVKDGRVTVNAYFHFEHARVYDADVNDLVDQTAEGVEQAVTASLRADMLVGVFLSGGVDSSLIAALAQRHTPEPVPVWTIAYDGQDRADYSRSLIVKSCDQPYAERVAARHGCEHIVVHVDSTSYERALVRTLRTNDLIAAWEQEISQNVLAEAASKRVKAVLVGDAADETHFGYSFLLIPERIASPRRIIEFFGVAPLRRSFLDDPTAYFTCKYQKFAEDRGYSWRTPAEQRLAMSCLITHLWLTRLMHNGDAHLMAHSLEGRVPFGATRLLELAQRIPQEVGYRDGIEKWHLRKAAERVLEAEIAWRPKSALTKNLFANAAIHRCFTSAWRRSGALLEPYVDADRVEHIVSSGPPETEREVGICFRLLAVLTWFERFAGCST